MPRSRQATDTAYVDALIARFDADADGSIEEDEIADVLQSLGLRHDAEHISSLMTRFDTDGSGAISNAEFSAFVHFL